MDLEDHIKEEGPTKKKSLIMRNGVREFKNKRTTGETQVKKKKTKLRTSRILIQYRT